MMIDAPWSRSSWSWGLDARSFVLRNQRRTTAMLGLVRLHLNGVDNAGRYAALLAPGSIATTAPRPARAPATTPEPPAASPPNNAYQPRSGADSSHRNRRGGQPPVTASVDGRLSGWRQRIGSELSLMRTEVVESMRALLPEGVPQVSVDELVDALTHVPNQCVMR